MTEHFDINADGKSLKATWETVPHPKGAILWLLGRDAARLDSLADRARQAKLFGRDILTFDYTGTGETGGDFEATSPNIYIQEASVALDVAKRHTAGDMTMIGASYGGYVAARLGAENQFNNLILRAPALFPPKTAANEWKTILANWAELDDYRHDVIRMKANPLFEKLARFSGRILLIEHGIDEAIPLEVIQAYRESLPRADYWLAPDVPHAVTAASPEARDRYEKYIAEWLNN